MKANQAAHSIPTMCRVLGVSASGYYAWQRRGASARTKQDQELLEQIRAFHRQSRGTYGAPRIHRDLRAAGVRVGRKRVARLLQQAGLRGVSRRKWPVTTVRAAHARPAPDLVQRAFTATGPNQLWVADITYIPTWSGTLYLAVVLDVWSRRIVGWAMATHLRTSLVVTALEMAITQRRPQHVIHHSDQGCQYTAIEFGRRCREANVRPSMGSVGDCYDNAMCESFFATLECELLDRVTLHTPAEARTAVFDFIEGWYNPARRHSSLDYESPLTFERRHADRSAAPTATRETDPKGYQRWVAHARVSPTAAGAVELARRDGTS
jgi:putative transposase